MTDNLVLVYKSSDGRYRSDTYFYDGNRRFCIVEKTGGGILITEFDEKGIVLGQKISLGSSLEEEIGRYVSVYSLKPTFKSIEKYERVVVKAKCSSCKAEKIARELDFSDPCLVNDIPIVPIFRCMGCGKRFYNIGKEYLSRLVDENKALFTSEETKEQEKDKDAFINTINEYIIRIFASKKINKIEIKE